MKMDRKDYGSLGGKARALKLTKEERTSIASKGGNALLLKYGKEYYSKIRQGLTVKDF